MLQAMDFSGLVVSMHPRHLWSDPWSMMDMVNPLGVCSPGGGCACDVKTCDVSMFKWRPTAAKFSTI